MSDKWIDSTIMEMKKSKEKSVRDTAGLLEINKNNLSTRQ